MSKSDELITSGKGKDAGKKSLIDPIYDRFVSSVIRSVGSTEFYEFFMDSLSRAKNEIEFSNKKVIKYIDLEWVDNIEDTLTAMQNIVSSPRNVIKEEDIIVNVANAKKSGAETVRHLAQHSALVEQFDEETGNVRPSRLMQRFREESLGLYENRLVLTTIEYAYHFVKIRYDALTEALSDEFGAKLKVNSEMESLTEHVHMDMFLHIKQIESPLDADNKNVETLSRIARMYRILSVFINSSFYEQMQSLPRVKGTVNKTNILKRNKDYRKILALFEYLRKYDQIGYTIKIVEQNPKVNEKLEQDIYHNILFNYLVLKGYLEDEADRMVPTAKKAKGRKLRPKFIHQIVEELTEDYNLPDVEIRKVLIEELTKKQLMQEEAAERRRLVEEQAERKKAERERELAEKKAEAERIRAEKQAERERIKKEKEEQEKQKRQELMLIQQEDRRRMRAFKKEIDYFFDFLEHRKSLRLESDRRAAEITERDDYADAVAALEIQEQRKAEEIEREKVRRREEKERIAHERALEIERLRSEQEAEQERIRKEALAEVERIREQKRNEAMVILMPLLNEVDAFRNNLPERKKARSISESLIKSRSVRAATEKAARNQK